jgi:hypothetical protein
MKNLIGLFFLLSTLPQLTFAGITKSGRIVVFKNSEETFQKGTYHFYAKAVVNNFYGLSKSEDVFAKVFNNGQVQMKIGSLHGLKIFTYSKTDISAEKYTLTTESTKSMVPDFLAKSLNRKITSQCSIEKNESVISHKCVTTGWDELFFSQPTQTLSCSLNDSTIICEISAYGSPKAISLALGAYKRTEAELAIAGTTELLKSFLGSMIYLSGSYENKYEAIKNQVDNILMYQATDILDLLVN